MVNKGPLRDIEPGLPAAGARLANLVVRQDRHRPLLTFISHLYFLTLSPMRSHVMPKRARVLMRQLSWHRSIPPPAHARASRADRSTSPVPQDAGPLLPHYGNETTPPRPAENGSCPCAAPQPASR